MWQGLDILQLVKRAPVPSAAPRFAGRQDFKLLAFPGGRPAPHGLVNLAGGAVISTLRKGACLRAKGRQFLAGSNRPAGGRAGRERD